MVIQKAQEGSAYVPQCYLQLARIYEFWNWMKGEDGQRDTEMHIGKIYTT